jgi:hypothetical protein
VVAAVGIGACKVGRGDCVNEDCKVVFFKEITKCKNQDQLSLFSLSTKEKASSIKRSSPSIPVAINKAPLYFPVKKVPSTLITGLQCLNASAHWGKHQYARSITSIITPLYN